MGGACRHSLLSPPGLPVPAHERRSVHFKNTPEIRVMTPQCTPPSGGRGGFGADMDSYSQLAGDAQPPSSFPSAMSPSRSRIPGPYDRLGPGDPAADELPQLSPAPRKPSWYQRLKKAAKALKHEVLAVYYAMQHPQTPWVAKAMAFLVLAYALSPLDIIPDFIPVLGIVDDLILLPLMIWAAIALLPRGVMDESRRRAAEEPLRLGRNWPLAAVIAAGWTACLEWLLYALVKRYGTPAMQPYLPYAMAGLGAVCCAAFVVWLVLRLRKERKKQRKAAAAAATKKRAAAAAAAVGGIAGRGVLKHGERQAQAGEPGFSGGSLAGTNDVEAGLDVVAVVSQQVDDGHAVADTSDGHLAGGDDAGLRQPLLPAAGREVR